MIKTITPNAGLCILRSDKQGFDTANDDADFGNCVVVDWWETYSCGGLEGKGFSLRFYNDDTNAYYITDWDCPNQDEIDVDYVVELVEKSIEQRRNTISKCSEQLLQINKSFNGRQRIPINRQELIEYISNKDISMLDAIMPFVDMLISKTREEHE